MSTGYKNLVEKPEGKGLLADIGFAVLPSSTYLFTAGVEGFCDFIRSHSNTHHTR
jgi:hypothetical protein